MKKKNIQQKLQLRKRVISNLDSTKIIAGNNTTIVAIRLNAELTTFVTKPEVCETHGDVCTMYCETKDVCY